MEDSSDGAGNSSLRTTDQSAGGFESSEVEGKFVLDIVLGMEHIAVTYVTIAEDRSIS